MIEIHRKINHTMYVNYKPKQRKCNIEINNEQHSLCFKF